MLQFRSLTRSMALAGLFGLGSAQAVPVVFQGEINIEVSGPYTIGFVLGGGGISEPSFYSLFWNGIDFLTDDLGTLDFVIDRGGNNWGFQFSQDIPDGSYDLGFSQALEKSPAAISFVLQTPDPNVVVSNDPGPLQLAITGLSTNRSYLANIAATDPFTGTLTISSAASGAPELAPDKAVIPAVFLFALLGLRPRTHPRSQGEPQPS